MVEPALGLGVWLGLVELPVVELALGLLDDAGGDGGPLAEPTLALGSLEPGGGVGLRAPVVQPAMRLRASDRARSRETAVGTGARRPPVTTEPTTIEPTPLDEGAGDAPAGARTLVASCTGGVDRDARTHRTDDPLSPNVQHLESVAACRGGLAVRGAMSRSPGTRHGGAALSGHPRRPWLYSASTSMWRWVETQ